MLGYRKVVAETPADIPQGVYAESPLGDLVTDAYLKLTAALQATDPPAIAVEGSGQLRSPIIKGKTGQIWFADLFRVLPLGIGPDGQPGFPLVTYYLNAKDIRSGFELGGASELVDSEYFLQVSGLKVEYDMSKPAFGRVSSLKLVSATGAEEVLDPMNTTKCYKIVSTNYVAGLLGVVKTLTGGLLSVDAKAADCTMLIDPTTRFVDANPTTAGVEEFKHWQAFLKYVSMSPDSDMDNVPDVLPAYTMTQGRITKK
jgi:5'-nucleotidase/UDP-sugar diphosphatase